MARRMKMETVLEAIKGSRGTIDTIAKRLDVSWHTARKYANKWKGTREAMEAELETMKDIAERTIADSIVEGNTSDAKWFLSRKAKDRGYGDKIELDGSVETQVHVFEIPDNGRMTNNKS